VVKETGSVASWSLSKDGTLAYGFASPRDAAELFLKSGDGAARKFTDLNAQLLAGNRLPKSNPSPSSATTTSLKSRHFSPSLWA